MKGKFPNGLAEAMRTKGVGPTDLARLVDTSKQNVVRWANGERRLTPEWAAKMARHLGTTPHALLLLPPPADDTIDPVPVLRSGSPLPYAGIVQAGAFLQVDDLNQDPEEVPPWVLPLPDYRRVRQYAWRARGDSMNEAGITEGMWIVGADAADYIDAFGDLETGDLVVVERTRYQGSERELTVKEVRFYRDRYELHPRSTNAEHKPIVVPHDHAHNGEGMEVKIVGVVLTAYADLKRRKAR